MKNKVFTLFKKLLPVYRTLYGPGNLKALNIIRLFSYKGIYLFLILENFNV